MNVEISYTTPQSEIFFGEFKKYNAIAKGRRFGLTRGAAHFFVQRAYEQPLNLLWVDVTYANLVRYYERYFLPLLKKFPKDSWSYNVQRNELKINNSIIDLRSADVPENIEGFGYHYIFLNEAGHIMKNRYLYQNAVLPMLIDYPESKLIAGGVPKGRQWKDGLHPFYELSLKATEDPANYTFRKFTSFDNPLLSKGDLENLVNSLDDLTKRQEIYAEFVDHAESPFLYAFDEKEHVIESYEPNINLPLLLSFDFNVSPMTAVVAQSGQIRELIIFDEFVLKNSSTPELCDKIKAKYPDWAGRIYVTGDASGNARNALAAGGLNHYKIIKKALTVRDNQFKVRSKNLSHVNSRVLCNSVIQNANFRITKNCRNAITDMIYASADSEGGLVKTTDQGNHLTDCIRYIIDAQFPDFIEKPHRYK